MHFSHFARISLFTVFVHIPNRTFLVGFGGISGEFGRAMVRILARRSRAKIPMARPNVPKFSPKFSVTVAESARRYTEWPARRIIRIKKR